MLLNSLRHSLDLARCNVVYILMCIYPEKVIEIRIFKKKKWDIE
jgi:hypothetical protein